MNRPNRPTRGSGLARSCLSVNSSLKDSGVPSARAWYAKGLAGSLPGLIAGSISLVSTGSATIAAVAAGVVTTFSTSMVERWFKQKEITAQEEAPVATSANASVDTAGALGRAHVTIGAVFQLISDADRRAKRCYDSLEQSKSQLAGVLGCGNRILQQVQETYSHSWEARRCRENVPRLWTQRRRPCTDSDQSSRDPVRQFMLRAFP